MGIEVRDDERYTSAMPAGSWLIGGQTASDPAPTAFGREAILAYIESALASVASSGSASDLTSGTIPSGRLHAWLADISEIQAPTLGHVIYFDGTGFVSGPVADAVVNPLVDADIGVTVQAYDADLTTLAAGGAAARAFLGLGAANTPDFAGLTIDGWDVAQKGGAFSGHASIVSRYRSMTAWPVGLAWQASEDRLWCFEWVGPTHGPSTATTQLGARIECWYTEDNGNTKLGRRTVYSDSIQRPVAGCAFGNMASGRIGGIVCVSDSAATVTSRDVYFVYSDDNCATWAWVELTGLSIDHFAYGMLMPLPAAYGGHATNGFCVVTYAGTTEAKLIKTTDNGANWTEVAPLLDGDATITNPQEPSLVFTTAGAIMFARAGSSANLFAAKSTDLTTWSAWVDTGVALGENPVHAVVDADDFVHVAVCDRDDFTSAVNENVVRTYRIAGADLYADLTAIAGVTPKLEWNLGYRGIGYIQSLLVGTEWYHFVKARESASTANAASADLALITTAPRPSPNMMPMLPPRQLLHNPAFDLWSAGTSFLNQTASAITADRWTYFPSGATADITQVTLTELQRLMFPHRPRFGLKLDTINTGNVHSDFVGIHQYFYGAQFYDLLAVLQGRQEIDFIVYGLGTPIPTGRISIYIDYGSGGSTDTSASATLTTAHVANDGSYIQTARVAVPIVGDPTIGTTPFIRVVLDCSSSLTAFAATITGVFAFAGMAPDEPVAIDSITNMLQSALADLDGTDTAGTITVHAPLSLGTTRALTVGTIEIGAASDTTISRASAGRLAVEGSNVLMASDLVSAVAATAPLALVNTNDSSAVQALRIDGDRATPGANDNVYASLYLSNSAGTQTEMARITAIATTVTAASEAAQMRFGVVSAGTLANRAFLSAAQFSPITDDGLSLGATGTKWSDLFLASGGVINWNSGNATLTHSTGLLTSNVPLAWSSTTIARNAAANMGSWYVLGQSSGAVSHTGNTTETALATIALPAGAMGANGRVRITTVFSYTNSANIKTPRVRFGSAASTAYLAFNVTTTASTMNQVNIGNRNSASSQVGGASGVTAGFGPTTGAIVTSALNTAGALDIVISGQLANGTETITLESYIVELLYAA